MGGAVKAVLTRKIPVNIRTVLFCLCAAGAISFPLAMLFRAFGYRSPELPGTEFIPLIAFVEILALPLVSLSLAKLEPILTKWGLLIFFLLFCSTFFLPAH